MKLEPDSALKEHLCKILGATSLSCLRVGEGAAGAQFVVMAKGEKFFLKTCSHAKTDIFSAEAQGLAAIRDAGVRVPRIIVFGSGEDESIVPFLLLEFLEQSSSQKSQQRALGEMIANLHQTTSKRCGFACDNYIGKNPQKNSWRESWADFFLELRLEVQIEFAVQQGWLERRTRELFLRKREELQKVLSISEPARLLHGDLWSGNVFAAVDGPALIDPACYFGHREADIAFTEMFGGFSADFYEAYEENAPLDACYRERKPIYNLYHLLNHANIFGGHYCGEAKKVLLRLL